MARAGGIRRIDRIISMDIYKELVEDIFNQIRDVENYTTDEADHKVVN